MDEQTINNELKRIEGMIEASKGNGELRWWKILQVLCSIAMVTILPWGIWVTKEISTLQIAQAKVGEWQAQGPRFTPSDGMRLKLEAKEEIRIEIGAKLDRLTSQLDVVRNDVSELKYQLVQHMQRDKP